MVKSILALSFVCCFSSLAYATPVDCNLPQSIQEKVICQDDNLREVNNQIKKLLAEKTQDAPEMIKYYQLFGNIKLKSCTTNECLTQSSNEFKNWLEKEEYKKLKDTADASRCQLQNLTPDCEIYAYSQYNGEEKIEDIFISDEEESYLTKVKINRPGKCVILFLSSYDATIWDIYATPQTKLEAINVGSHCPQMLRGMSDNVQTKNRQSTSKDKNDICLDYYYDTDKMVEAIENLNLNLKNIVLLDKPIIGDVVADAQYYHNPQIFDGQYVMPDIKPGDGGLKQLIEQGKIRKGNAADIQKIKSIGFEFLSGTHPVESAKEYAFSFGRRNMYIMLSNFDKLPKGLAGSDSIILFVPKDLTPPDSNEGHSNFYRFNASLAEF